MLHIVLFQPEIPPNTGNVIRLCANSGTTLHLVKPLGFELTRKAVRRAGLDYEELAQVRVHASLPACLVALADARRQPQPQSLQRRGAGGLRSVAAEWLHRRERNAVKEHRRG
jgi:tRNA (cytidine(34)-2'-O)-methyltransferase